jgi:hypothetical protein
MREIAPDPKIGDKGRERKMALFALYYFWVILYDMTFHFYLGIEGVTADPTLEFECLSCRHCHQLTIVHSTIQHIAFGR